MDAERFDSLTRTFAARLPRRSALRRTGGLAAALLAATGLGRGVRAAPERQTGPAWHVAIDRYRPTAGIEELPRLLGDGYAPLLRQQPGFVQFSAFWSGGEVVAITVFEDAQQAATAAQVLAAWVDRHLTPALGAPAVGAAGDLFAYAANPDAFAVLPPSGLSPTVAGTPTPLPVCTDPARPGLGCPCITGTRYPCGQTTLVCCKNDPNGPPGSPGTCVSGMVGCNPRGLPPTVAP